MGAAHVNASRVFAGMALVLGMAAAFSGSPYPHTSKGDRVTALELAAWIRDRRPGLRVIDARSAGEFTVYQIPTAENVSVAEFDRLATKAGETIVVYFAGDGRNIETPRQFRSAGGSQIHVLDGGINAWLTDVMNPAKSSELTRYFGGIARPAPGSKFSQRRGC
jgi:rhodanese-related sulfurtransferase